MYNIYRYHMSRQKMSEVNVVGAGTELVIPDIVVIEFYITTIGKEINDTEELNSNRVDRIIQLLNQFGIQDKDIDIQKGVITPMLNEEEEITGYQANTLINVTFYDLATINEFYNNIKGKTDIRINQIILMVKDLDKYYLLALNKAVLNVYKKANSIAGAMNGKLVHTPVILTETSNIENILNQIIITETVEVEKIKLNKIVIPATIEAKFLVESLNT